ncbi:hypothetical protein Glove_480g5 [Diversispora epigaea]|uniref:Uncharacterized protein n=1 Tax=Diversispora epigaea TaxID=1348612 RepID=A0A397GTH6_9GLOM|nr:hypothetical protein Glove_480g5 [Diversispora epigaea]
MYSFSTLISGTHKKTSRPSASSSRLSVRSSRPSVSSSRRAARNNNISESNDDNKTITKVFKNLKIDFADMKKGQSGIETNIKKIKNEICLLTNDKKFIEDIIVSTAKVILKLNLYPSPQEYKESCEAYIQQFHEDVYNSFGRKWNVYYESKIQSKLSDKIRTLCGKIRTAMYDIFGNQLRPIKSNAKSQEILNWKQLPSTKNFPGNPTYMEAILKKVWSPTSKPPEQHEKIKNKETFEIESESESEPENSPPPFSSSPKKWKSAPESVPTLNNENLLQNEETRISEPVSDVNENLLKNRETRTVPLKRKSAPEPASDVSNDGEIEFPLLSEIRKRAEEKARKRNYEKIFESENENESENESENETIISGLSEPKLYSLNHYLAPIINQLIKLWEGFKIKSFEYPEGRFIKGAVICCVNDISASHKLCEFISAHVACHRCNKSANLLNNQSNFDRFNDFNKWFIERDINET